MRLSRLAIVGTLLAPTVPCLAQSTQIRHVILTVAATNDEWTTSGLNVQVGDLLIVRAPGYVNIGGLAGDVDASGTQRGSTVGGGNGALEFKVGVGAGQIAGKSNTHELSESGELKFRVRDSNYRDNRGQYDVDVVIIPPSAIPPATSTGTPEISGQTAAIATITTMKSFLRNLVTAEESYFATNSRYTNRITDLTIRVPEGVVLRALSAQTLTWSAIASSPLLPTIQCGVAVGANASNPLTGAGMSGEPACKAVP